jgi:hypothetical protein
METDPERLASLARVDAGASTRLSGSIQ